MSSSLDEFLFINQAKQQQQCETPKNVSIRVNNQQIKDEESQQDSHDGFHRGSLYNSDFDIGVES